MGHVFFFDWEVHLMLWIQNHMGSPGLSLASLFTLLGEELALILVLGFCYWCWDKELGVFIGVNCCAALVWNPMLKNIALRRRPYFDTPVQCLRPVDASADIYDIAAQGFSFPSGHSTNSAAAYGSLAVFCRKRWVTVLGVLLPLLVGISRFCLGVHYPTDVICGWALGCFALFLLPAVGRMFPRRWQFYLVLCLTGLPGFFYCRTNDFFTAYGMMVGFFAGNLFEQRFVRFQNTQVWRKIVLRLAGGVAVFFVLNAALKTALSPVLPASGTAVACAVRALRYGCILFVDIALYPMLFDRLGKKA